MTKHEEILTHIKGLQVGSKISVRSVAGALNVSEGTAYRAIKEAETTGLVSTIPRVGTIRIEKAEKKNIESLTFSEVVNIVDGVVLGGKEGLYKSLNKFVIGAMTIDAMKNYISPNCLLIVGNREDAYKLALESGAAILITGGFGCSYAIKHLADEQKLPIISSSYDTFTIATMINKAISESLVKKDIIMVEDIMNTNAICLDLGDTVGRLRTLIHETRHSKYPVIDSRERLVGIVTTKDLNENMQDGEPVSKIMTKNPVSINIKTSAAHAAHIMVWDSIELIPVVDNKRLMGILSRNDVIRALQQAVRQPHVSETFEDMLLKNFSHSYVDDGIVFKGRISPEMYSPMGSASTSSLTMLMSAVCASALRYKNNFNIYVDSFNAFFMKPVPIDTGVMLHARVINSGRNFAKVDVEMYDDNGEICTKGMMSAKIMKN